MKQIAVSLMLAFFLFTSFAVGQDQLYRVRQIRAAPGELLNVIELLKSDMKKHEEYGIAKPYLMRHSQGDQWDLLLIYPVDSISGDLTSATAIKKSGSHTIEKPYGHNVYTKISWLQDSYVKGPSKEEFERSFENFDYYHVEIFTSLAGKQSELLKQRKMENVYLDGISRRRNQIYTRAFGPAWDIFTIGFYKDVKDYAASADIPNDVKEKAAKKAGFESINTIGSYLRELILVHHDTLAGAVRPD